MRRLGARDALGGALECRTIVVRPATTVKRP